VAGVVDGVDGVARGGQPLGDVPVPAAVLVHAVHQDDGADRVLDGPRLAVQPEASVPSVCVGVGVPPGRAAAIESLLCVRTVRILQETWRGAAER